LVAALLVPRQGSIERFDITPAGFHAIVLSASSARVKVES